MFKVDFWDWWPAAAPLCRDCWERRRGQEVGDTPGDTSREEQCHKAQSQFQGVAMQGFASQSGREEGAQPGLAPPAPNFGVCQHLLPFLSCPNPFSSAKRHGQRPAGALVGERGALERKRPTENWKTGKLLTAGRQRAARG